MQRCLQNPATTQCNVVSECHYYYYYNHHYYYYYYYYYYYIRLTAFFPGEPR